MLDDQKMVEGASKTKNPIYQVLEIMKLRYQKLFLVIVCMGVPLACAEGNYVKRPVDICIGNLCLEKKELTYQASKKMLGAGATAKVEKDEKGTKKLCYFDTQQQLWLLVEFEIHTSYRPAALSTIFVSTEQTCIEQKEPLTTLKELKTDGGVRVGMTEMELLKLKGQPARVDDSVARGKNARFSFIDTLRDPRFGEKVIVYLNEDRIKFNFFYISDGKVKSILVSDAE